MRDVPFAKYEGLGNDFLVIDASSEDRVSSARAVALCDRRFGVGADGVLLVLPARDAANSARMKVLNADGSVPEMCGNGLRCVALHVARASGLSKGELAFETDAGVRRCAIDDARGDGMVTVDMGLVRVVGEREICGVTWTLADAGNPHAVVFGEYSRADVERLGPEIATDAAFPRGTNVEFARLADAGIELVVYERGVGVTMACGTGACAVVAAARAKGLARAGERVDVRLPGGVLEITVDEGGRAIMRGPARRVFTGIVAT